MIAEHVHAILSELKGGNGYGEEVLLVAATKTRTPEEINEAIAAGVTAVAENRVQEFRAKDRFVSPTAERHFIGRLQCNKVKYLAGKIALYHSVDGDALAMEISRRSKALGTVADVLIEVNVGGEESKGGFAFGEAEAAYERLKRIEAIRVRGFMAMLPAGGRDLPVLCKRMRGLYDAVRREDGNIRYLSMGMSGDWKTCVEYGANVIRLGSAIFGERT